MTGDQLRQQMQGGRAGGITGNGQRLGLPKELDFSSDENEEFLALDANDQEAATKSYVGFKLDFKSGPVKLGEEGAFNKPWQKSVK